MEGKGPSVINLPHSLYSQSFTSTLERRMTTSLTLSRRIEVRRISNLECDEILDRQRRLAAMARDTESLYSIVDLHMLVAHCRDSAKAKILAYYGESYRMSAAAPDELVLHAAAELKVSPLNTAQLLQDYPNLISYKTTRGMLPLHVAVTATGVDHVGRVRAFLNALPEAAKVLDAQGLLPVQVALLHGAEWDVVKLLIDAFPSALQYPFLPCAQVPVHFRLLIGFRPFHMACTLKYELSFLFQLLAESQDSVAATSSHRIHINGGFL
jgi:hypothetical protein